MSHIPLRKQWSALKRDQQVIKQWNAFRSPNLAYPTPHIHNSRIASPQKTSQFCAFQRSPHHQGPRELHEVPLEWDRPTVDGSRQKVLKDHITQISETQRRLLLMVQKSGDHQLRLVVYPHYLQGFIHPRWFRISSINRTSMFRSSLKQKGTWLMYQELRNSTPYVSSSFWVGVV